MFVHHVLFYMPAEATDEDRAQLRAGLESLKAIDSLKLCLIGTPADTNRPVIERGYTYSLLTLFEDAAGEAAYQIDPIHLAFVDAYKHLWNKVVIYDAITKS
jgi:Stress responsive A/B Barrel Domain